MGTKKKDVPPEETQRIIVVGRPDYERCDNKISTSKYNVFTFLPIVRTFVPFFFSLTSCCIAALVFFKKRYFRQIQAMDPCRINTCCSCCCCVCVKENDMFCILCDSIPFRRYLFIIWACHCGIRHCVFLPPTHHLSLYFLPGRLSRNNLGE
jgi:hypothetical protein